MDREKAISILKAHSSCEKRLVACKCNINDCSYDCEFCIPKGTWGEFIEALDFAVSELSDTRNAQSKWLNGDGMI